MEPGYWGVPTVCWVGVYAKLGVIMGVAIGCWGVANTCKDEGAFFK